MDKKEFKKFLQKKRLWYKKIKKGVTLLVNSKYDL